MLHRHLYFKSSLCTVLFCLWAFSCGLYWLITILVIYLLCNGFIHICREGQKEVG